MVTKQKKQNPVEQALSALLDPKAELDHVKMHLAHIAMDDSVQSSKIIQELRARANKTIAESEYHAKRQELDTMVQMLQDGPLRLGSYVGPCPGSNGAVAHRVEVLMENGDTGMALADSLGERRLRLEFFRW